MIPEDIEITVTLVRNTCTYTVICHIIILKLDGDD